ncbi:MAG TPA: enoyl-CoA hydratase/isomerase family protein [Syntrophomonas sp.]|nr:enoyl-CoA hydratase/isomerase family protein [Syntrophomonas sp.]
MENYRGVQYQNILAWTEEQIGYVQFNRSQEMNAISPQLLDEFTEVLRAFDSDSEIRVIIICGNEKAFSAGADLGDLAKMDAFAARDYLEPSRQAIMEDIQKPVITAIRGMALGGGFEIVLSSDIRIAGESAMFALPEIRLGLFPGGGGTQRWLHSGSICTAKYYIFTGDFFDAQTALKMDLINMVVPDEEVMNRATKIAKRIAKKSPLALREAKQCINNAVNLDLRSGLRGEQIAWSILFSSSNPKTGIEAFFAGKEAVF